MAVIVCAGPGVDGYWVRCLLASLDAPAGTDAVIVWPSPEDVEKRGILGFTNIPAGLLQPPEGDVILALGGDPGVQWKVARVCLSKRWLRIRAVSYDYKTGRLEEIETAATHLQAR